MYSTINEGNRQLRLAEKEVFAKRMRENPTDAELAFRDAAKAAGVELLNQHVLLPYIVDFFSQSVGLVIEIDGHGHFNRAQHESDRGRTQKLMRLGCSVFRLQNADVIAEPELCVEIVRLMIQVKRNRLNR